MTKAFVHNKQKVRDMNSVCKSMAFPLKRRSLLTALYSLLHQKRLHLSQKIIHNPLKTPKSFTSVFEKRLHQLSSAVFVHQFGQHLLDLHAGHVEHGVPAARTSRRLQGSVTPRARSEVTVSWAALGRPAALDEGSSGVRVLLSLQRGGREDVGGETSQLVGTRARVRPVIIQLK